MIRNILAMSARNALVASVVASAMIWTLCGPTSLSHAQPTELTDQQFDQWLYSGHRDNNLADSQISLAIESIDRVCHLTPPQRDKLQLAGRGDFVRLQQQVDSLRSQYVGKIYDQNEVGKVLEKLQPLINTYRAGLFGSSSLFSKVLHRSLTPEQLQEYDDVEAERLKQRHNDKVRLFVGALGRDCPLKEDQRLALVKLLETETRPPKRSTQYDMYVVLAQASKIPDEKFAAILDPAQTRLLKKSLERGRGIVGFLKQQDILP
jgi:hypothetical protein